MIVDQSQDLAVLATVGDEPNSGGQTRLDEHLGRLTVRRQLLDGRPDEMELAQSKLGRSCRDGLASIATGSADLAVELSGCGFTIERRAM